MAFGLVHVTGLSMTLSEDNLIQYTTGDLARVVEHRIEHSQTVGLFHESIVAPTNVSSDTTTRVADLLSWECTVRGRRHPESFGLRPELAKIPSLSIAIELCFVTRG